MSENIKTSMIPRWDGKSESCGRYIAKLKAIAMVTGCGDAMDPTKMRDMPTKSQYDTLNRANAADEKKGKLYDANARLAAYLVLGQDSDHGLALLNKTTTDDYPEGIVYKAIEKMKVKSKPKDASAKIEMDNDLDRIQFRGANDYYNDVVAVLARYEVNKSETELVELLAKRVTSQTYSKMVLDHLDLSEDQHDLETICTKIDRVQRIGRTTSGSRGAQSQAGKEV